MAKAKENKEPKEPKEPKGRNAIQRWQREDAARLKLLFNTRDPKLTQEEFAATYKIGTTDNPTQGLVSQYLNGVIPLNLLAAARFAKGLGCTLEEISPTLASMGKEVAAAVMDKRDAALAPIEADLLQGYRNAPKEAQQVIHASVLPFIPKRRKGAGRRG